MGSYGSELPIAIAGLGYQVCTIDVRRYPLKHPDLVVIQGDITKTPFQVEKPF